VRRLLGSIVVIALMLPALASWATGEETYRDDFGSGSYGGDDGSLEFSGPWSEFGDPEGAGPDGGWVHVGKENCSNNECLHIEGYGLVLRSFGAQRSADLSVFTSATLSFDVQVHPQGLTTTELQAQVYNGSGWVTVSTFDLSQPGSLQKSVPLDSYLVKDFAVRFQVSDLAGGGLLGLDILYDGYATVDKVQISGVPGKPTSTSSSTSTTAPTSTSSTTGGSANVTTTKPGATSTTTTIAPTSDTTNAHPDRATTTTRVSVADEDDAAATTTTVDDRRSDDAVVIGPSPGPPPDSGLRVTSGGVMADYQMGMMGDMPMGEVEVLGAELTADFSLAVEAFGAAKVWIAALALLITAAIVSGMDWRRTRRSD
jgi:hypothetical protein